MSEAGRDRVTGGTVVVRDGRVIYATVGAQALLGRSGRDLLGRGLAELVAPEDRERVMDRHQRRLGGEPVPSEYELLLLLPDGAVRTAEARISVEGSELVLQLQDLSEQAERRRRLEGLAALGVAIQRERAEAAIHGRVRAGLQALGLMPLLLRPRGDELELAWGGLPDSLAAAAVDLLKRPLEGLVGPWSVPSRTAWSAGASYSDDWVSTGLRFAGLEPAEPLARLAAGHGLVRSLAVRLDERRGSTALLVAVGEWIRGDDLPAFRLFGAQVAAALDAARDIAELTSRNVDLAALAELGALAGSQGTLEEFLPRALELVVSAVGCQAAGAYAISPDGKKLALVGACGLSGPPPRSIGRAAFDSPLGAVVSSRRLVVAHLDELDPEPRAWLAAAGLRTFAWVPLVARSRVLGVLAVGWRERFDPEALRPELLLAMGAHLAAAMESHDLLRDLRRRVAELTLLNDVAVATASFDPVLLLENALKRICETLEADGGHAHLLAGGLMERRASVGLSPGSEALLERLEPEEGLPGQAVARRQPVVELPPGMGGGRFEEARALERMGAVVAVPLLAKERAVGVLCLFRREPRPFAFGDLTLLSAIGVQLGVAVDAARQHADVRRRARDLETIHALALRVLSAVPGETSALLQEAAAAAARALSADQVVIMLLDEGGATLSPAAVHGLPIPDEVRPLQLSSSRLVSEALASGAPSWTENTALDPRSAVYGRPGVRPVAMLAVPLAARTSPRGVLLVAGPPGHRFSEADRALVSAMCAELALALENAELYAETRRRAEELEVLQEVGRSLVATLELPQVLDAGVRNLARSLGAPEAYLVLLDEDGAGLETRAVAGPQLEELGRRFDASPQASLAGLALARREVIRVDDARHDARLDDGLRRRAAFRSALALPLLVRDSAIGAAVIVETGRVRHFTDAEVGRAAAIANQLAVAVDHARAHARVIAANASLQREQEKNIRRSRLEALGELSAVIAHEVRNPLGVIFNSLGSLRRLTGAVGDTRMLLDIVGEEADRLNRIVGDLLDFARHAPPQLAPDHLEQVVEEAVSVAVALPTPGLEVVRSLGAPLPVVALDAGQVRQAVLNLVVNAVQAMPGGGRLTVRTLLEGATAVVEVEDTGPGIPELVRARIFEPFFTTKASGTGLGLPVVKRIVEGHGGELRLRTGPAGSCFSMRFPLVHPPSATPASGAGRVRS
jgi:PAS domain S-box-containing protein